MENILNNIIVNELKTIGINKLSTITINKLKTLLLMSSRLFFCELNTVIINEHYN